MEGPELVFVAEKSADVLLPVVDTGGVNTVPAAIAIAGIPIARIAANTSGFSWITIGFKAHPLS